MLGQITNTFLEAALNGVMTDHLGHENNRAPDERDDSNVRNETRTKTVISPTTGPVTIQVRRDRDGTFTPVIVPKRHRRLTGINGIVLSSYARGLTTGEISAHFNQTYGAQVSRETISRGTDKVIEEMQTSQSRPLDSGQFLLVAANPEQGETKGQIRT
nr:transposase [Cryobacterium sp. Hb1]